MERTEFIKEKRRAAEVRMDTLFAPDYDAHWGDISATHRAQLAKFLALCPPHGTILDAACGTGKYWACILESSRRILGIDQSRQMLANARAKFPDIPTEKIGMQEMAYAEAFDGLICMDAMEYVFPEDWPRVLRNFHRALKPNAPLYLTVELAPEQDTRAAFEAGKQMGLPVVEGEWAHEGGSHYYPSIAQVQRWMLEAKFRVLEEATGDEYYHLLARKG